MHSGDPPGDRVMLQALHQLIRQQGQVARGTGCGQRGALGAEVAARRATSGAGAAVMAGRATGQILREDRGAGVGQGNVWRLLFQPGLNGFLQRIPGHGLLEFTVGRLRQTLLPA